MKHQKICVLGGSGFVGRHLIQQLVREGYQVRVLTRRRELHKELLVLPTVELNEANIFSVNDLGKQFKGCDAVINLIGILNARGNNDHQFRKLHVEIPQNIAQACRQAGIKRLLHMSALNADASRGRSYYLRTKGDAESFLQATKDLDITIFRPSVIFGDGDSFLNRFAKLLKKSPLFFPLPCASSRIAPVYVGDVIRAISHSLRDRDTYGQCYELCGPTSYTLKELVEYTAKTIGVRRKVIGLGNSLSYLQAFLLELMPGKPFSVDNFNSLQVDSVCQGEFPPVFEIDPTPLEAIAPLYLAHKDHRDRYPDYRRQARR